MQGRLDEVHRYWFGESDADLETIANKQSLWFGKNPVVDTEIRERFGDLVDRAVAGEIDSDPLGGRRRLAVILLLDQFTRNIYRGERRSFASDPLARKLSKQLIASGGEELRPVEKLFLYLPLEHSEDLDDQKRSVALFHQLYDAGSDELKPALAGFYDYAVRHYDIIARFGRFPHRNRILGRVSTPVEEEFLRQPGSGF